MTNKDHWDQVYSGDSPERVSWYQDAPHVSLRMIESIGLAPSARILDVGGGSSTLVDHLLDRGFGSICIMDISQMAIRHSQKRLGDRADQALWLVNDVKMLELPEPYDLWHDRALLHFMTEHRERARYAEVLRRTVGPGGHAIISTFSVDGPQKCSGLPVRRYDAVDIENLLGSEFGLCEACDETHLTPSRGRQIFSYFFLRRNG